MVVQFNKYTVSSSTHLYYRSHPRKHKAVELTATITPTPKANVLSGINIRTEPKPVSGCNYTVQKYLFRLHSSMTSSRWYEGLNCTLYTTGMTNL